jgi:hypothetical protein
MDVADSELPQQHLEARKQALQADRDLPPAADHIDPAGDALIQSPEASSHRSRPPLANPDTARPSPAAPILGLTPELMAVFELAGQVSDTADYDYEMALHGLRANARENSQRLRYAIGQLPPDAHSACQLMITMLGSLGETIDDATLLAQYALAPDTSGALKSEDFAEAEERQVTKWTALFSLARMREHAESASNDAVMRVLEQADAQFARTLFIELEVISGVKSSTYRDILLGRGISTTYTVPSGVTPLDVERLPSDATKPPAATN